MSQVPVILLHPNRLFAEGMAKIFENGQFKFIYAGANYDYSTADPIGVGKRSVFIVGGHSGVEVVAKLRAHHANSLIMFAGEDGEGEEISKAFAAGANCYLRETVNSDLLLNALDILTQNELLLGAGPVHQQSHQNKTQNSSELQALGVVTNVSMSQSAVDENGFTVAASEEKNASAPDLPLSARELIIVRALVEGCPNKVIANRLDISEATVKVHVKAICRKIRAKNRTQAAIWAVRRMPSYTLDEACRSA
jgi:two-component system nitrate/nitrite response regulator NarL